MDRISNLPDEIICHILSFLSTKEAVLTSPLAKRWRNLFAFSPNLRFERKDFVNESSDLTISYSFTQSLERILDVSSNLPIKSFSFKCRPKLVGSAHIKLWIRNLLSRGVLERLHLKLLRNGVTSLPLEVFTCKTLVTMKLKGFDVRMVPKNASLPCLKTLILYNIKFLEAQVCPFETLLSACSMLEELKMCNVDTPDLKKHYTVTSQTLKRLTLYWRNNQKLTFDTPNLAYLDYSHIHQPDVRVYPDVNLDSLFEVKLDLVSNVYTACNPNNLIKGLRNVRILNLSTPRTTKNFYAFREAIPVFKNLVHLSIATVDNKCCRALPLLLKNAPNLETLVIQYTLYDVRCGKESESICECLSGVCLLTCRVKVLKINMYRNTIFEREHLKHFLKKLRCLKLVIIRSWETEEKECLQLTKDLLKLRRSSKRKIKLEFIPLS